MKWPSSFSTLRMRLIAVLAVFFFAIAGSAQMAQAIDPENPGWIFPCGPGGNPINSSAISAPWGVGVTTWWENECEYYNYLKAIADQTRKTWAYLAIRAGLNTLQKGAETLAVRAAQVVNAGLHGEQPAFFTDGFEQFLSDVAEDAVNRQIDVFDQGVFTHIAGFSLCQAPSLQMKLSLGLKFAFQAGQTPPINCSLDQVRQNFDRVADSLSSAQLAQTLKQSVAFSGNDLSIGLNAQIVAGENQRKVEEANILNRMEGRGFRHVTDFITGKIQTPSQVFDTTLENSNAVALARDSGQINAQGALMASAWIGLKQLPAFAASAFVSTFAQIQLNDLMTKVFAPKGQDGVLPPNLVFELDPNAENSYDGSSATDRAQKRIATFMADIFRPNLSADEKYDFILELTACTEPRGLWGCSLDERTAGAFRASSPKGALTVAQAAGLVSGGGVTPYINPNWELIPEWETKENQDPDCHRRAFCAANLAKLRFARLLPIGWELAANSPFNVKKNGKYVTLAQVMEGFSKCNAQGQPDGQNPWCGLVDPNWTLVAPPFKCVTKSFTDAVTSAGPVKLRQQECTDVTSCLERDDKGNCVGGYGYCVADKLVWRFGADQCDEKYASCRSYQMPSKKLGAEPGVNVATNKIISFVRNTIDYGKCNVENTGCLAYASKRFVSDISPGKKGATWDGIVDAYYKFIPASNSLSMDRVYFDKTVKPCDAANEGCTKVLVVNQGSSALNLVENSSFEEVDEKAKSGLKGWSTPVGSIHEYPFKKFESEDGAVSYHGATSALFPPNKSVGAFGEVMQIVAVEPLRNYTVSVYSRSVGSPQGSAGVGVKFFRQDDQGKLIAFVPTDKDFYYSTQNCAKGSNINTPVLSTSKSGVESTWTRESCEFSTPDGTVALEVVVQASNAAVDAVQLEEGVRSTDFIDGVATNLEEDSLKLAPEDLKCTGNAATDVAECAKFAKMCKQTETGCQAYTDLEGGEGIEIPATLTQNDFCPNSCIGYAEYRKLPSSFDLTQTSLNGTEVDPADKTTQYFIPTRGQSCTAAEMGCEAFTDIASQAEGGEQKAFYSYARACEQPSEKSKTFFTWEGSDAEGYQIKTWSMIGENQLVPSGEDATDVDEFGNPLTKLKNLMSPKILVKAGPDGVVKKSQSCDEKMWKTGTDPDCRQFYNEAGDVMYVYYSQTVVSSPLCTEYRKDAATQTDCALTGGDFRSDQQICIYKIYSPESVSCSAQAVGCRGWLGTSARNTVIAYQEDFRGASNQFSSDPGSVIKLSKEALFVGDSSLEIKKTGAGEEGATIKFATVENALYTLSFWAKAPGVTPGNPERMSILQRGASKALSAGTIQLGQDWKRFEVGPFTLTPNNGQSELIFIPGEALAYLDTVTVQRVQDVVYVAQNSWSTPAECDLTARGVPQPQAMLGCRAYRDRKDRRVAVREFNSLCKFESVGCSAYVDTRNSASAYKENFVLKGGVVPDADPTKGRQLDNLYAGEVTVTRAADRYVYVIDEPSAHCDTSMQSCRAFGKPNWNHQWRLGSDFVDPKVNAPRFDTVYLIDDITKYQVDGNPEMLCRPDELFCDAFASGDTTSYFRDPGDHVCEWKENVAIAQKTISDLGYTFPAGQYSGWFVKGADRPCYPDRLSNAKTFLTEFPSSMSYRGFTSLCPKDQSECTEIRDPADRSDMSHPEGKPYFFIRNTKIDRTSCEKVDPYGQGCVMLRDASDGSLKWNVGATMKAYQDRGHVPTAPIDCENPAAADAAYCKGRGVCRFPVLSGGALAINEGIACDASTPCIEKILFGNVNGKCILNDTNMLTKVKLDRDCATWMGCKSGETIYDEAQQKYVTLCTQYDSCDKTGGATQGGFCAHYQDRKLNYVAPTSPQQAHPDMTLREGVFMDGAAYAYRRLDPITALTTPTIKDSLVDYSGYTIPNRFQPTDMVARRMGYELLSQLNKPDLAKIYADDYRLVASVPLVLGTKNAAGGPDTAVVKPAPVTRQSEAGYAVNFTDSKYPTLKLCQHEWTKQVGYYLDQKEGRCFLAIDTILTQVPADVEGGTGNKRDIQTLIQIYLQQGDVRKNTFLSYATPASECRAHPDENAPFGNEIVKEWDVTKNPAVPKKYVAGYEGVAACERGEDCACQYAKVSYGQAGTKYYEVLSRNAPPQGICIGGNKPGSACIPDANAGDLSNVTDFNSLIAQSSASQANNTCGTGGSCVVLSNATIVRGFSGYCMQRDSANPLGDKGRFSCLAWHPQPILNGTRDVYHFSPSAGYTPPINSGEYFCVAPVGTSPSASVLKDGSTALIPPGKMQASGFLYDERCVNASYEADKRFYSYSYSEFFDKAQDPYEKMTKQFVDFSSPDAQNAAYTYVPNCSNIDGTDIRKSQMALHCGANKVKIEYHQGGYVKMNDLNDLNLFGEIKNRLGNLVDGMLTGLHKGFFPDSVVNAFQGNFGLDLLYAPFAGTWKILSGFIDGIGCFFKSGTDCVPQMRDTTAFWFIRTLDRASFAMPVEKQGNASVIGIDTKSIRMVSTGEGVNRSYAEYFIPSTPELFGQVFSDAAQSGGAKPPVYESQIGYFSFHVPMPGKPDPDFADEKDWNSRVVYGLTENPTFGSVYFRNHIIQGPTLVDDASPRIIDPNPGDEFWGFFWDEARNSENYKEKINTLTGDPYLDEKSDAVKNEPALPINWVFSSPLGDDQNVLPKEYGQLGCAMSTAWVDEAADFNDWTNEAAVIEASKQWHDGFRKEYPGLLSRSNSSFVKNSDGGYLKQLPCSSDPQKLCYYKYWESGYRLGKNSAFEMFDPSKNPSGPNALNANSTYFHRAESGKPYFAIRAMFEDMNEEDNKKNPIEQPNDGSALQGPFKFVGFWVTAAAPGTNSSQHIYMRMSVTPANSCRDVAQVISPKDRANAAFTDRVWEQNNFVVPGFSYNYTTENTPFGSAIHQRPIGKDPMLMLDASKGITDAGGSFVKPGTSYAAFGLDANYRDRSTFQYKNLSNLYARIYQVYSFYDVPVQKTDFACFGGPFTGRRCVDGGDAFQCDGNGACYSDTGEALSKEVLDQKANLEKQVVDAKNKIEELKKSEAIIKLATYEKGGYCPNALPSNGHDPLAPNYSNVCPSEQYFTCGGAADVLADLVSGSEILAQQTMNACQDVKVLAEVDEQIKLLQGPAEEVNQQIKALENEILKLQQEISQTLASAQRCVGGVNHGGSCSSDEDCVSGMKGVCAAVTGADGKPAIVALPKVGNDPVKAVSCVAATGDAKSSNPDKDNNRCTHGVGYYPRVDVCPGSSSTGSDSLECLTAEKMDTSVTASYNPPSTDRTAGYYATPKSIAPTLWSKGQSPDAGSGPTNQRLVNAYTPRAPRVAAPDTSRQCASPGQCPIAKLNSISIDNVSEGALLYYGSQIQSTARFYAWAADDQAPITDVWMDWGDGSVQKVEKGRIKNKKPFCGIGRQCEFVPGLSCGSDADCPPGAGKCFDTGVCSNDSGRSCFYNADCGGEGVSCVKRLTYGNTPDACEANYFEFTHTYECTVASVKKYPSCALVISLAAGISCADIEKGQPVCRFIPKVFVKDNWGWCTGDCKETEINPTNALKMSLKTAGGCYDGSRAIQKNVTPKPEAGSGPSIPCQINPSLPECGTGVDSNGGYSSGSAGENFCDAATKPNPWIWFGGYLKKDDGKIGAASYVEIRGK